MIRRRIAERDDRVIVDLIRRELLPHSKRELSETKLDRREISKRLSAGTTFVITNRGMRINGFVTCFIRGQTANIDMLAVSHHAQGKGLGSKLMRTVERYGQRRGCDHFVLFVDQGNRQAQHFYQKKGYVLKSYLPEGQCFSMEKKMKSI